MRYNDPTTRKNALKVFHSGSDIIMFDTETTGLSSSDKIIELAAVKMNFASNGGLVEKERLHLYFKPPFPMPAAAAAVNGYTDEFLADKPSFAECFETVKDFFGNTPVGAYNSQFDVRMMRQMYADMGEEYSTSCEVDILKMAKDYIEDNDKNWKMSTVCELMGVAEGVHFHGAMDDTQAMINIADTFFKALVLEEKTNPPEEDVPKVTPHIYSMSYWNGPNHTLQRIYIRTDLGSFYFDMFSKTWNIDKKNDTNPNSINWEEFRQQALSLAGVAEDYELAKWKKTIVA